MWFKDKDLLVVRKPKKRNRKRSKKRAPILMVNSRGASKARGGDSVAPRVLMLVLAAALLGGGGWCLFKGIQFAGRSLFSQNPRFTVENLEVHSGRFIKKDQVMEWSGVQQGMNLFGFSIRDVQDELEKVALIHSVEIQRKLPDSLTIRFTERMPVARLGKDAAGFYLIVDAEGYVIMKSFRADHLPAMLGVSQRSLQVGSYIGDSSARGALSALEIANSKPLSDYLDVKVMSVGHPDHVDVRLHSGERLLLPRTKIESKLRQATAILQVAKDKGKQISQIDLTTDHNVAVKYRS